MPKVPPSPPPPPSYPAFPTTGTLDSFDRPNENPASGWTSPVVPARPDGVKIDGGRLAPAVDYSEYSACLNESECGPDSEAYVTLASTHLSVAPTVYLFLRINDPGGNACNGYACRVEYGYMAGYRIFRIDNGTPSQIAAGPVGTPLLAPGQSLGFAAVANRLVVYRQVNGQWNGALEATDNTYAGTGLIGVGGYGYPHHLDNFGGGGR